jgi:hypothetical protein
LAKILSSTKKPQRRQNKEVLQDQPSFILAEERAPMQNVQKRFRKLRANTEAWQQKGSLSVGVDRRQEENAKLEK